MDRYGYHWSQADNSMIHFSSPQIPKFDLGRSTKAHRYSLGMLDRLPLELLHQILQSLDFRTLVVVRSLNFASRSTIDSLPAFSCMTQYGAVALRALSQTRLIRAFAAADLFRVLRSDRCIHCGQFGAFLFLLTCSRCCYECLEKDARLRAIDLSTAKKRFGLEPRHLRRLPTMLSLPGSYALRGRRSLKKRLQLVSAAEVYALAKQVHKDGKHGNLMVASIRSAEMLCLCERSLGLMLKSLRDPYRGFASTAFPSLDSASMCLQLGISCRGCEEVCHGGSKVKIKNVDSLELVARRNRAFSEAEFKRHMQECAGVRWLQDLDRKGGREAAMYWSNLENFDTRAKIKVSPTIRIPIP